MNNEIFKIEAKPTFWHVTLTNGVYSDRTETHYFIAANSPEEAREFFKIYWKQVCSESYYPCLIFENEEKFNPTKESDDEINWSTDYGNAQDVEIEMLKVIHINKLK